MTKLNKFDGSKVQPLYRLLVLFMILATLAIGYLCQAAAISENRGLALGNTSLSPDDIRDGPIGSGGVIQSNPYTDITAQDARVMKVLQPEVLFLDVREVYEYDAGHIPDALNMPWNSGYLSDHHEELPDRPIIVYCASGFRSALASQFLIDNGHRDIYNMLGGYIAWTALLTLYVPQDYTNIQDAINASSDGYEIIVSPDTYYENIYVAGKDIILRSTEPTDAAVIASTIIDGNKLGSVVTFSGTEGTTCVLAGFTLTNGYALRGGGTRGFGTQATIQNCLITNNISYGMG